MTDNVFSLLERLEQRGDELDEMAAHRFSVVGNAVGNLLIHEQVIESIDPPVLATHPATVEAAVEDVALSVSEARHNLDVVYGVESGNYAEYQEAV